MKLGKNKNPDLFLAIFALPVFVRTGKP